MSNRIKLSIHLCPEFGWTNTTSSNPMDTSKTVFGPGSVLKGFVRIHNPASLPLLNQDPKPDRLRIIFHASETFIGIPSSDLYPSEQRYQHEQFFGSQRILWTNKDNSIPLEDGIEFQFTIQLPMVQFPASMEIDNFYKCKFRLSAYLEGACRATNNDNDRSLVAEALFPIHYRPHIKTRAIKQHHHQDGAVTTCQHQHRYILETMDKQRQKKFRVQLNALEYIAGDTIEPLIHQPPSHEIHMQLFREFIIHPSSREGSRSSNKKKKTFQQLIVNGNEGHPLLELPDDLIPSYSFGRMVSVTYKLRISFHPKDTGTGGISGLLLNSLKSSNVVSLPDIPIQIGTLAYGLRPSDELQVYTEFKTMFQRQKQRDNEENEEEEELPPLPVPKYVSSVEYKDALPVYEDYELPPYQEVF
ncbi:hypothetical protein BDA99DRAFT_537719 [Phascolomyces articulosus]|uniref:Arrestin-like N-terminal domain-containing protein n=1 Tax=Phascolomyces articulosus TaxID=60185 RepID=A0AAD5PE26_9FUNG|nr:hypothetical protein BDA99DRAFT_537719 [Phascolomyces articulosus]